MDKDKTNNQENHSTNGSNTHHHSTAAHHSNHHKTEAFGLTEKELNSKDEVQKRLTLTFDWLVAHKVFVVFLLGLFILSGIGFITYDKIKKDTELKAQEKYFLVEKKYLEQKNIFDEAEREKQANEDKKKSAGKTKEDVKPEEKKPLKALPTGDIEKDYGSIVKDFEDLVSAQPRSNAGKMAAIVLADIYIDHNKFPEALASLNKLAINDPKILLDFFVLKKKVNVMLSLAQFSEAEKILNTLINQKKYSFLNSQFKILLALAYEGQKQWDKAESQLQEIIAKGLEAENFPPEEMMKKNRFSSDISTYEQAQKYLLLLKTKKDTEKAGS